MILKVAVNAVVMAWYPTAVAIAACQHVWGKVKP